MKQICDRLIRLLMMPIPYKLKPILIRFCVLEWPIAVKVSTILLIAALVPMTSIAYFNLHKSLVSLQMTEYRNLELLATITASRLDQLIIDTNKVAGLVAENSQVVAFLSSYTSAKHQQALHALAYQALDSIRKSNSDYASVFLLDPTGLCLMSTNPKNVNKSYAFRDYYKGAIKGKSYISDLLIGSTTEQAGLYFSVPVKSEDKQIVGIAVLKLQGARISKIVDHLQVGEKGDAFLIDQYGIIINDRNKDLLYSSLAPLSPAAIKESNFVDRFAKIDIYKPTSLNLFQLANVMIKAKNPGHTSYLDPKSEISQIVGFAPLRNKPWVVGVKESEEQFASSLNQLAKQTDRSVFIVGAIVTILALLFARTIVKPIQALTKAAHKIEKGELEGLHIKVYHHDELGVLAQAFNTMIGGLRDRQKERDIFGRVVSPEVREKLLNGNLELGGETRICTVLFSDIRGFSTISEQMVPQAVMSLLNEYLTEMTAAVRPWGGYINNFIGDAIIVIFGAPIVQPDQEWCAVSAALAMRDRLEALNQRRITRGEVPIRSGIGISTGEVVAGQIGSMERLLYTVIGDAVNVAARLESLTKEYPEYPILINHTTAEAIKNHDQHDEIILKPLGPLHVKGRVETVEVYGVIKGRNQA